jgi:hypothetical protein
MVADECSRFAEVAREAIVAAWLEFLQQHREETPYAFALIGGQCANWLGYAVATEEGLRRAAIKYDALGYQYQGWEWEEFDNCEKLAVWLRWENPDEGWYYGEFPKHFRVMERLRELVDSGAMSNDDADGKFEEFCVDGILSPFKEKFGMRTHLAGGEIVLGFTWGEDPRDFLRTATRVNPYSVVTRLWGDVFFADEAESRIKSPYTTDLDSR